MHTVITEELIRVLHRERVNAGVRAWLINQALKEPGERKCRSAPPWRIVPLGLRPAHCR